MKLDIKTGTSIDQHINSLSIRDSEWIRLKNQEWATLESIKEKLIEAELSIAGSLSGIHAVKGQIEVSDVVDIVIKYLRWEEVKDQQNQGTDGRVR